MAIFVVEDDAQNGSDHVDAHRTVALAISPYIKRHSVDSTLYSTSSMLRTMELILGLEPMSQFDAAARPMFNSFTRQPDFTPYVHRPARVDLNARNTPRCARWPRSRMRLDLEIEDRADDLLFNEIIWKAVKGSRLGHAAAGPRGVRAAKALKASALLVCAHQGFTSLGRWFNPRQNRTNRDREARQRRRHRQFAAAVDSCFLIFPIDGRPSAPSSLPSMCRLWWSRSDDRHRTARSV